MFVAVYCSFIMASALLKPYNNFHYLNGTLTFRKDWVTLGKTRWTDPLIGMLYPEDG